MSNNIRAVAFYLPQFHPIPENDEWWGRGFTEWRNVTKAKPLFPGHYQPHLPADLGFYDLRLSDVREAQAELARNHGIHGFCYYHYWFSGRQILERPFEEVLQSGKPDFPFCLCWANENWTRAWDGGSRQILLEQRYSDEDDLKHIQSLIPALRDARYIRVDGKPLLLIYRTELLPNAKRTAEIWRSVARDSGIGEIYLARVENFEKGINPESIGFDAAVEFAPDQFNPGKRIFHDRITSLLSRMGILPKAFSSHPVYRYRSLVEAAKVRPVPEYKQFRCVTPSWDNTARRTHDGRIWVGCNPNTFEDWLRHIVRQTYDRHAGDERIVFVNAWNEWAEGCHLEPDLKWGKAYLEAVRSALSTEAPGATIRDTAPRLSSTASAHDSSSLRRLYWNVARSAARLRETLRAMVRLPI